MKTHNKPVIMLDLGGVYFTNGTDIAAGRLSRKYRMPKEKIKSVIKDWKVAKKYYTGEAGPEEYWAYIAQKLRLSDKQAKEMEKIWYSSFVPKKKMRQLVRKLRKKYRVAILSGNVRERVRYLDKKYKLLKEFHGHHFSFDHGFSKPDVRLFKSAARKMRLRPADCIVVDDSKKFLNRVRKTGAKTILFRNARQLEAQLRKLGVHA